MAKILLVDDDKGLCEHVSAYLSSVDHHTIDVANNAADAKALLNCSSYDVVVLDWELPDQSGIDILQGIRDSGVQTPVMMLTAKADLPHKERGFLTGADDYLTKPFHMRELALRLRALIKRESTSNTTILTAGEIEVHVNHFKVLKNGKPIELLPREFAVLEFLMRHKNEVFSAEALLSRVWSAESESTTGALRICVNRLRKRIDTPGKPSVIQNIRGLGYTVRD